MSLPEGTFKVEVQIFDSEDKETLKRIYREWRELSDSLSEVRSRAVNLPDGLSEGVFCLATGAVRKLGNVSGANSSFDCYDRSKNSRIQVKGASVIPDLTSFGPQSVWDEIYFLDFCREGQWDGLVDIYYIDNQYIYQNRVNRNQAFTDQQAQGRRPRFSIYTKIIQEHGLNPLMTYALF